MPLRAHVHQQLLEEALKELERLYCPYSIVFSHCCAREPCCSTRLWYENSSTVLLAVSLCENGSKSTAVERFTSVFTAE